MKTLADGSLNDIRPENIFEVGKPIQNTFNGVDDRPTNFPWVAITIGVLVAIVAIILLSRKK